MLLKLWSSTIMSFIQLEWWQQKPNNNNHVDDRIA